MKHYISEAGSILPICSTILFLGMFLLVVLYLLTDKRRAHHERMRGLALSDEERGDEA